MMDYDGSLWQFVSYNPISDLVKGLGEIVDDVVDMLCADAEADSRGRDMLLGKFLR